MQSEISQTEKDKYCMILFICGLWKTIKNQIDGYREQIGDCQREVGSWAKWANGVKVTNF